MSHRIAMLLVAAVVSMMAADAPPAVPAPAASAPAAQAAAPASATAPAAVSSSARPADAAPTSTTVKSADKPRAGVAGDESRLTEEEKWVFEPTPGRIDPFYDLAKRLKLELEMPVQGPSEGLGNWPFANQASRAEWAKAQMQKVEAAIVAKKWDEAIKTCDVAIKSLSKDGDNEEAQRQIEKFKRYRSQAEEAKTYEEAQAKFDALDLRIEGILWSPEGSLAVVSGEPRARGVNERVKDCVIINIDTNRVDFLFYYNRRRFEFQRYVGEDAKASAKRDATR